MVPLAGPVPRPRRFVGRRGAWRRRPWPDRLAISPDPEIGRLQGFGRAGPGGAVARGNAFQFRLRSAGRYRAGLARRWQLLRRGSFRPGAGRGRRVPLAAAESISSWSRCRSKECRWRRKRSATATGVSRWPRNACRSASKCCSAAKCPAAIVPGDGLSRRRCWATLPVRQTLWTVLARLRGGAARRKMRRRSAPGSRNCCG